MVGVLRLELRLRHRGTSSGSSEQVPEFVKKLYIRLTEERQLLLEECAAMAGKVEHAKSVIAIQ